MWVPAVARAHVPLGGTPSWRGQPSRRRLLRDPATSSWPSCLQSSSCAKGTQPHAVRVSVLSTPDKGTGPRWSCLFADKDRPTTPPSNSRPQKPIISTAPLPIKVSLLSGRSGFLSGCNRYCVRVMGLWGTRQLCSVSEGFSGCSFLVKVRVFYRFSSCTCGSSWSQSTSMSWCWSVCCSGAVPDNSSVFGGYGTTYPHAVRYRAI